MPVAMSSTPLIAPPYSALGSAQCLGAAHRNSLIPHSTFRTPHWAGLNTLGQLIGIHQHRKAGLGDILAVLNAWQHLR